MKNSDINNLLELGLKNHQENKLDKAVYYYDKAIKENKENIKANLYLGVVFAQQRKFIEAKTEKKTSACKNCEDTKIKREKCVLIRSTFNETNNISAASRKLGVSRTTIYKHIQ